MKVQNENILTLESLNHEDFDECPEQQVVVADLNRSAPCVKDPVEVSETGNSNSKKRQNYQNLFGASRGCLKPVSLMALEGYSTWDRRIPRIWIH